ncbi:restriction endonuclease subunit S [Bacteroidia bacterium]|nr:restriction endonuclease subunit S [Bacteroidia bacterium]
MINSVNFNEVVDFLEGPGVRKWQFRDSGIKLINIRNLVESKLDLSNTNKHLDESEVSQKYSHFLLKNGDYVMASSGVTWGKIAEVKEEHLPLCLNTSIIKLKPKNNNLEKRFLWHFIKAREFRRQIDRIITGSAQPNFGPSHLHKISIPLPPLEQQKKIAAILDAADAYRQKTKALIEKYDELTQSLFLDMFGDPVGNPKGWESSKLGLIVENKDSKRKPVKSSDRENMDGDYPYYGASGIIDYVNWFTHEGDNLLIGEDGANLLARSKPIAFIAKGQYWVNNHAHVLGFNGKALLVFIEFFINLIDLSNYVTGSAQPKLNRKNMDQIKIFCPPIELQNQFADSVKAIEAQKAQAQESLAKAEDLFNSLLQKAFKGELTS